MYNHCIWTFLIVFAGLAWGCHRPGRYTPSLEVEPVTSRSAEEDLTRLQELFKARGGRLFNPTSEEVVHWRGYRLFRVYTFQNHAVAVYLYNWDEHNFNVAIYAGHLPDSRHLINTMAKVRDPENTNQFIFPDLSLDGGRYDGRMVGMDGVFLGQSSEAYIDSVASMPNNVALGFLSEEELRQRYAENFKATDTTSVFSRICYGSSPPPCKRQVYHEIVLENNRVIFIQYVCPDPGPILGRHAIDKPQTPVLESGTIDIRD